MSAPVRWGILGTGAVSDSFAAGLRQTRHPARLAAVVSRDSARAADFAARHGGAPFDDLDAALDAIDALYVATPPEHHAPPALSAIGAGVAVLIEKPLAWSAEDARQIKDAAGAAGLPVAEAMWTRFQPLVRSVAKRIAAGELGASMAMRSAFLGAVEAAGQGDVLGHRAVYGVSLARLFLGVITNVQAAGHVSDEGHVTDATLMLTHAGGAVSQHHASFLVSGVSDLAVFGTDATLTLDQPIWRPVTGRIAVTRPAPRGAGGGAGPGDLSRRLRHHAKPVLAQMRSLRLADFGTGNGFSYEADALMDAMAAGQSQVPQMPLGESVEVVDALDRARRQITGERP